jgi:hypothetical protein
MPFRMAGYSQFPDAKILGESMNGDDVPERCIILQRPLEEVELIAGRVPPTIEDPAVIDEIKLNLGAIGYPRQDGNN